MKCQWGETLLISCWLRFCFSKRILWIQIYLYFYPFIWYLSTTLHWKLLNTQNHRRMQGYDYRMVFERRNFLSAHYITNLSTAHTQLVFALSFGKNTYTNVLMPHTLSFTHTSFPSIPHKTQRKGQASLTQPNSPPGPASERFWQQNLETVKEVLCGSLKWLLVFPCPDTSASSLPFKTFFDAYTYTF